MVVGIKLGNNYKKVRVILVGRFINNLVKMLVQFQSYLFFTKFIVIHYDWKNVILASIEKLGKDDLVVRQNLLDRPMYI